MLGGLLTASYQHHLDLPAALGGAPAAAARETLGGAVEVADGAGVLGPAVRRAAFEAFTAGMHGTALLMTAVVAVATVAVARVLGPTVRRAAPHPGTRTYAGTAEEQSRPSAETETKE